MDLISDFKPVQGIRLHYYRTGNRDGIPVVLVHGITDDGLCWMPVIRALPEKFDVYLVDQRGHGKSDAPETGYTLEDLELDLEGLIRALPAEKPILIGHSLGAIVTLILAGTHPDTPRAIILEDPPPFWKPGYPSPEHEESRSTMRDWMIALKRKTTEDLLAEVRGNSPRWSEAEVAAWVESKQRFSLNILEIIRPQNLVSMDYRKIARSITCPVEFLSADVQLGASSSPADVALLQEWIPQMTNTPIQGAGHGIHRDQMEKYMEALQGALENFTE